MEGMLNNDLVECRLVMLTMIKYVHSLPEIPLSDQEKKLCSYHQTGLFQLINQLSYPRYLLSRYFPAQSAKC